MEGPKSLGSVSESKFDKERAWEPERGLQDAGTMLGRARLRICCGEEAKGQFLGTQHSGLSDSSGIANTKLSHGAVR